MVGQALELDAKGRIESSALEVFEDVQMLHLRTQFSGGLGSYVYGWTG